MSTVAVARLSFSNGIRQPMTWLVITLGVVLVGLSYLFGMFSFEDSSRMRLLITAGVATTVLCGCFLSCVTVAQAVNDELTSRTALTLFAKPIPRHSFLLGKVLGILGLLGLSVLIIALWHLVVMWFAQQQGFNLDERARSYHQETDVGYMPWLRTLAAHCLGIFGNSALLCLAAVLSLRFAFGITLLCTFGAFVLSHVAGAMGWVSVGILPALSILNVDDALHFSDVDITPFYFILNFVHALLYSAACLIIGISVLQRQDIP